ncbi:MAG TPA: crossover junction endodeoxyribonuclease RuvC [Dehalococcoidia bacterium]|nr:crossover junction endodeoxyribonuclease RuvC [Dehalococcoidia bacterium]
MAHPRSGPAAPLTVLGIDPGLAATGYGVILVEDGRHRALDFGAFTTPARADRPERLLRIHDALSDIIRAARPDEVAVEDFIVGHVRAAVAVGEARAVALLAAAQAGLPVSLYKPLEVKQFVTTYGRGSKEQVAAMVQALLGLDAPPQPPDAADALAVALCHCLKRASGLIEAPS